jgi:hypothetical protein
MILTRIEGENRVVPKGWLSHQSGYINMFVTTDAVVEEDSEYNDGVLIPDLIRYGHFRNIEIKSHRYSYIHVRTPDGENSVSEIICVENHYLPSLPHQVQSRLFNKYEDAVMDRIMFRNDYWEIWSKHHHWIKTEDFQRRIPIINTQRRKKINRTALLLDKVFYLRIFKGCPDDLIRIILSFVGFSQPINLLHATLDQVH